MAIGFPGGGMFSRSGGGQGLGNLLNIGGGEPNLNNDQINQLLQQFGGINLPGGPTAMGGPFEQMPGISRRAPSLAYGLDNALIALANMGPTGATAGENISNVARGLEAIGPTRRAQQTLPLTMGMQLAQQVGQVRAQGEYMKYLSSMADYYGKRNQTASDIADRRLDQAVAKQALVGTKAPMLSTDGQVMLPEYNDTTGKVEYVKHPEIDPTSIHRDNMIKMLGGSDLAKGFVMSRAGQLPKTDEELRQFGKDFLDLQSKMRVMGANVSQAGANVRQVRGDFFKTQQDVFRNYMSGNTSAKVRSDRFDNRVTELMMGMKNDPNAYAKATAQARTEEQAHTAKLQRAWTNFSLMSPEQQQTVGGIDGYLEQQGYNSQTDTFDQNRPSSNRSAPQDRTLGGITPGVNLAPKPTASTSTNTFDPSKLSPNVRAILQSLTPQPQQ